MIKSVTTLAYGIILAVLVIAVALLTAVWVLGMAIKAALFGGPKSSLAVKIFERAMKERQKNSTDITVITPTEQNDG